LWENPPSKDDKSKYRERFTQNFWALYREIASKIASKTFSTQKLQLVRYGLFDTAYITPSQQKFLQQIDESNNNFKNESILLADEWLLGIAKGDIPPSVLDETAIKKKGAGREKIEGKRGQLEAEVASATLKVDKIMSMENELRDIIAAISDHIKRPEDDDMIECYTSGQRESITNMLEIGRNLLTIDRQLGTNYNSIDRIRKELLDLEQALEKGEDYTEISDTVYSEFLSFRQMVKMCGGKQGNHFPILYKSFLMEDNINIATKENVYKVVRDVEKLDPSLFVRSYKNEDHRVEPYFIIIPSYGERGICWEPFSRSNRATSKGRLAIPMYPRNLIVAVLSALGDIRWQLAKEKAQHYWMEEGLTGYYYEYFTNQKLKGDIKKNFINDYILWIAWESKGVQRLHKDVRSVFWRYTPFPEKVKESLKNKGFYYQELYKKDQNRARSDGY